MNTKKDVWLKDMIRIDTGTNRVIYRFQKADLLHRTETCDTPALILAILHQELVYLNGGVCQEFLGRGDFEDGM